MNTTTQFISRARKNRLRLTIASLATGAIFLSALPAPSQATSGMGTTASYATLQSSPSAEGTIAGSVPSGPATNEVLHLTLRDAVNRALRYNLGTIESGENATIARGQRLLALSDLLPKVSAG